jgi:hypothetical protein
MAFEPLAGNRFVRTKEDHKTKSRVKVMAELLDNQYKDCSRMLLVEDNLSAHRPCTFMKSMSRTRQKPTWVG